MYLIALRLDIMFAVCACARHQVTPKEYHLHVVKRIFRYLNGHPKLGLWYPKESPFDLVAYSDSDYYGANQDRKSTTGDDNVADLLTKAFDVGRVVPQGTFHGLNRDTVVNMCINFLHGSDSEQRTHEFMHVYLAYASCLSPKSTGFNEFSSKIATALVCLATNRTYNFSKMIFDGMMRNVKSKGKFLMYPRLIEKLVKMSKFGAIKHTEGESSENPTEPHHTSSAQYESTHQEDQTTSLEPMKPDITIPSQSHFDISTPRRLTRGTLRISQSKVPSPGAHETASPIRDDRHEEAFPTATSLDAGQDRENIGKTSAIPHESSPRVTSLNGGEGNMQQKLQELMDLCTNLQQQHLLMEQQIQRGCSKHKGMDQWEDLIVVDTETNNENSTEKGSDNTDEMANVLSTLGAANVLSSGGTASTPAGVDTASGSFPTAVIFTITSVTIPYTRKTRASRGIIIESSPPIPVNIPSISKEDNGKWIMTVPEQASKENVQEQMSAQLARELEAKELEMMIAELDRINEMVAKYLSKYKQAEAELLHDEKLATKAERRKFYMSVLRSNAKWKSKDFKGMTFKQIEEKFIPVWKQMQDFMPMNSKLESKRVKRPEIQLVQESSKKLKTAKASGSEPSQEQQTKEPKELYEEELKKMMEIVPIEEVYIEALQAKYPIID
ncbi:hypothetical protein Tco_0180530 [Tanacetum coccineum]